MNTLQTEQSDGNTCPDGQAVEPRRSQRQRHPTDRMREYMDDAARKCEDKLLQTYNHWRVNVRTFKSYLKAKPHNDEELCQMMDNLKANEADVIKSFEHLRSISTPKATIVHKVDACSSVTNDVMRIANEIIAGVSEPNAEQWKDLKKNMYANSIFSWTSQSSQSSRPSSQQSSQVSSCSKYHEKMVDAAADLAAKQAELVALKAEEKKRADIERAKLEHQRLMDEHMRELERMKLERSIEAAQAKVKVYSEVVNNEEPDLPLKQFELVSVKDEAVSKKDTTQEKHSPPPFNMQQAISAPAFQPASLFFEPAPVHRSSLQENENIHATSSRLEPNINNEGLVQALADTVNLNRLPIPEPSIFNGDPLYYIEWKTSFQMLIEHKGITAQEKIFYLKRYVGDSVKKALHGYFLSSSPNAYNNAMKILDERYGHPFILQKAFRDKLDRWPRVPPKDPLALRDLADFLQSCLDASQFIPGLNILSDCVENQKLLAKLPDWVAVRWNREVTSTLDAAGIYPPFSNFVDFVANEARVACNPVSSLYALHDPESKAKSRGQGTRVKVLATSSNQGSSQENRANCEHCNKEGHFISKCYEFKNLPLNEKRAIIKEKRLCFGCLRKGHQSKDCRRKHTCATCKGKHPTCLHDRTMAKKSTTLEVKAEVPAANSLHVSRGFRHSTSMIVPVWVSSMSNPTHEILTYAILDTQSDTTFILDETVTALRMKGETVRLNLSTMTAPHTIIESKRISNLQVRGFKSSEVVTINHAYTRDFIPANRSSIPVRETAQGWAHLHQLTNSLPPLQSCEVGLLIGYNCPQALAPRKTLTGKPNEPYAVETPLGWSVIGYVDDTSNEQLSISHRTATKELPALMPADILKLLEADFAHDKNHDAKVSQDDILFLNILSGGIHQRDDKHLEMPLPFKERPTLPNNKPLALLRLDHLKRKLKKNEQYHQHYTNFMNEILARGDAEVVSDAGQAGNEWYIPHHGVYHPRKPDKLRVVFDCSAKYRDTSLNHHLLTGPDLTNGLAGVLCRFRRYETALLCDIEKMFHQFIVPASDRDFLRFFWWEGGNINAEPTSYRMKVHLFGAASSPGCANYGLKYLARAHETSHPKAASFIQNDFYVDDGLTSVKTVTEAIQLIHDAQEICSNGGLRLHKFVSNNLDVTNSIPTSERATDAVELENRPDRPSTKQTLGIKWNTQNDTFMFNVTLQDLQPTRRSILSTVASIFDPLGLLSPFVLKGKQILQACCHHGIGWNDPLPKEKLPDWDTWHQDLQEMKQISLPRCLIPTSIGTAITFELHHFSDASTLGYGQCSYLRIVCENTIHCALVMGKSRVAPLKVVTIPRLELTAAVLSVKVSLFLRRELGLVINNEHFWTDSKVVLGYINNEARRFHIFVANRVQIIRDASDTSQWHYIDTENNPADHASRGLSASQLTKTNWLSGPSFLWQRDIDFHKGVDTNLQLGDPEVKSVRAQLTQAESLPAINELLSRIHSWITAVSVMARILRLANGVKDTSPPTVEERKKAEHVIITWLQRDAFGTTLNALKKSETLPQHNILYPLDPVIINEVICVGGRLEQAKIDAAYKHPAILPRNSHISMLLLAYAHQDVQHQGRGMTLNKLRSLGYWILGGSKLVASYIRQCVLCRKMRRPTETQKMADLPHDRVEPSPPFTFCGMDCFGPFLAKQGRKEVKRYGLLFTCMCSRAIHIEMLDDMSTDTFINSLRCFIAIRGAVRQIRSDQGSNFVGAKNELEKLTNNARVTTFLAERQCDFILNAPSSSHTGGVWERQIRTVRSILDCVLSTDSNRLDDSSLRTIFYEVMSIVNSRPLSVSEIDNPKCIEPLTPNHILTFKSTVPLPPPGEFIKEDIYLRKKWRRVQFILEQFWSRWRKEYLSQVTLRQKWHAPKRNIRVGDIVLVKDIELPRMQWPMGRVIEANPDADKLVRRIKVKMGTRGSTEGNILERSIHKLVLLIES